MCTTFLQLFDLWYLCRWSQVSCWASFRRARCLGTSLHVAFRQIFAKDKQTDFAAAQLPCALLLLRTEDSWSEGAPNIFRNCLQIKTDDTKSPRTRQALSSGGSGDGTIVETFTAHVKADQDCHSPPHAICNRLTMSCYSCKSKCPRREERLAQHAVPTGPDHQHWTVEQFVYCNVVLHTCFLHPTWKVENNSAWSTRTSTL